MKSLITAQRRLERAVVTSLVRRLGGRADRGDVPGWVLITIMTAGLVIHLISAEQDLRKMGGLARYLPWTYRLFLVGALSLAAIPPFSGFFSKDSIPRGASAARRSRSPIISAASCAPSSRSCLASRCSSAPTPAACRPAARS